MKRILDKINFVGKRLLSSIRKASYEANIALQGEKYLVRKATKRFRKKLGRSFDWENPQTLNEILTRNKIISDTSLWSQLADKHAVREYVESRGLSSILVGSYGVWDDAHQIDFEKLPESFIIKPTNGCAKYMIVRDKSTLDLASTRDRVNSWLHNRFGYSSVEPHYLRIKPRIIVEELLQASEEETHQSSSLIDYKWYCFNGHVTYAFVASNRSQRAHSYQMAIYDSEWVDHSHFVAQGNKEVGLVPRPAKLEEMISICSRLSVGLPFVRVDLYEVGGKVYFGELTMTPAAGYSVIQTEEFDRLMGEMYRKYNH
ncbi:MAG: ATP-grasp fold amidoligase family protein [Rikenellaceae bacterium]